MKSRKPILVTTIVLATACAALLVLRIGGCRKHDLETHIGTRQLHEPVAGEAFKPVEDWPHWRGPRGDGISREKAGEKWPDEGLKKLWSADVGIGYSSPIAAGGRLYLFSLNNGKDNLSCFDADSGRLVWSDDADTGWSDTSNFEGTRATPAIDGDAIYTYGGQGDVICRNLANGKPRWRQDVIAQLGSKPPKWGLASSPLVSGGKVFVQSGVGKSVAVALDQKTGALAWSSEATGEGGYAPIIQVDVGGTPQLIVFTGSAVIGMNPASGQTIWRQAWSANFGVAATTPVYRDGKLFISSGYGRGGMMLELSASGAKRSWKTGDLDNKFQGMILDGDSIYGNAETAGGGGIVCLNWNDGSLTWRAEASELKTGAGGSMVKTADGKMVMLSDTGVLTLAAITPKGLQFVSRFQAVGRQIQDWSTPLLYGGRIYVKGPKELVCYQLPL